MFLGGDGIVRLLASDPILPCHWSSPCWGILVHRPVTSSRVVTCWFLWVCWVGNCWVIILCLVRNRCWVAHYLRFVVNHGAESLCWLVVWSVVRLCRARRARHTCRVGQSCRVCRARHTCRVGQRHWSGRWRYHCDGSLLCSLGNNWRQLYLTSGKVRRLKLLSSMMMTRLGQGPAIYRWQRWKGQGPTINQGPRVMMLMIEWKN